MSDDFLGDRKKALEESFFAKENEKLLAQMREKREKAAAVEALASASKLDDRALLEKLVGLGIDAATWAALSLVPLVEVAWADGEVVESEIDAVLEAATEFGVERGTPSYDLLQSWLEMRPNPGLFAAWGAYAAELAGTLDPKERKRLRDDILQRAQGVARSAGGILGIGAVSENEKRVLIALERPFN